MDESISAPDSRSPAAASESQSTSTATLSSATLPSSSDTAVRSRFDSRSLHSSTASQDDDGFTTTARYLTHQNPPSSLSFTEAFAAIRQTTSYTSAPPQPTGVDLLAPTPSSTKDTATVVLANRRQTGNPLLKAIKNVSIEFRDGLVPDYVINASCCVLFLSVRYHLLHGGYLEDRLQGVKKDDVVQYKTKIVLCMVDVDDNEIALREINRVALLSQFTLILAWSWPEAARYIETLKSYENKSAALIKEKIEAEFLPQANDVFTTVRSVNKTDVVTLLSTFGTPKQVMNASLEELALCPGIGAKKVRQLLATFQEPFTKQ